MYAEENISILKDRIREKNLNISDGAMGNILEKYKDSSISYGSSHREIAKAVSEPDDWEIPDEERD